MRNEEAANGQVYELSFLALPSIPEDKISAVTEAIRAAISKEGGKEIGAEEPFKHPLAYSISKRVGSSRYVLNDAYIGWIKFEAEPEAVSGIKANVEKIAEVVRFLLVKAPRETTFTFAKARALAEERERKEREEKEAESSDAEESVAQAEEVVG